MTTTPNEAISENGPARSGRRRFRQPLWIAAAAFVVALLFLSWSLSRSRAAEQIAERNTQNAIRARRAASELAALLPRQMNGDSGKTISVLVDQALHTASVPDHQLRNQSIRSLGALGQTGVLKNQARIEIAEVSLSQAGAITKSIEASAEPLWIESAELTASSQKQWNLVLQIDWLSSPGEGR